MVDSRLRMYVTYPHYLGWRSKRVQTQSVSIQNKQSQPQLRPTPMAARVVKLIPARSVFLFCDVQIKFRAHSALH